MMSSSTAGTAASGPASAVEPVRGLGYRADVDGLRGVAILLVLLFHAGIPWVRGGYSGVDVFFVISGYLIGFQVSRELREERFALVPFYEKRVRRILPALFAVIAFTFAAGLVLFDARELRVLGQQSIAATASLSNIFYWLVTNYFSPNSHLQPLLMTWSLGIEVQFYLLLPLLALLVCRWSQRLIAPMLAVSLLLSLAYSTVAMHHGWAGGFYLLPSRWWELAAGAVLGAREANANASQPPHARPSSYGHSWVPEFTGIAGLVCLLISVMLPQPGAQFLLPPILIPVAGAVLLCMSPASWVNRRLLASAPLSGFGRRSYSVYLWHWPLLSLGTICGAAWLSPWSPFVLLAVALVLAEVSYRFVELPFRRPRSKSAALRAIAIAGLSLLVLAGVCVVKRGFPSWRPKAAAIEDAVREEGIGKHCLVQNGTSLASVPTDCMAPRATVALLGDSHAGAIAPVVRDSNPDTALLMKVSCSPLLGVGLRSSGPDLCSGFLHAAVDHVKSDPAIHTVILAGYWLNPVYDPSHESRYVRTDHFNAAVTDHESWSNLRDGLLAITTELRAAGKDVVLVDDVPFLRYDPHLLSIGDQVPVRAWLGRRIAGAPLSGDTEPHLRSPEEVRVRALLDEVASSSGSRVVSLYDALCSGADCRVLEQGQPLFVDRQHLSARGARLAVAVSGLAPAASRVENAPVTHR